MKIEYSPANPYTHVFNDYSFRVLTVEEQEDWEDIRDAQKALKEGGFIPWEQIKREYGIE